jgi:hypothetical protein
MSNGREVLFVSRNEMDMWAMVQDYEGSVFPRRANGTEITKMFHFEARIMTLCGITSDEAGSQSMVRVEKALEAGKFSIDLR